MNDKNQIDFEKVNELVILANKYENSRNEKREVMIEIASETIEKMFEIMEEKEEKKGEFDWLKKELIGIWIWKITQTPRKRTGSKYKGQKYWTKKALGMFISNNRKTIGLRHEHVFEKGKLAEAIIQSSGEKEQIKEELEKAICCIVTKEEHEELHKSNELGWKRYIEKKKVKVVDLISKEILTKEYLETL